MLLCLSDASYYEVWHSLMRDPVPSAFYRHVQVSGADVQGDSLLAVWSSFLPEGSGMPVSKCELADGSWCLYLTKFLPCAHSLSHSTSFTKHLPVKPLKKRWDLRALGAKDWNPWWAASPPWRRVGVGFETAYCQGLEESAFLLFCVAGVKDRAVGKTSVMGRGGPSQQLVWLSASCSSLWELKWTDVAGIFYLPEEQHVLHLLAWCLIHSLVTFWDGSKTFE